jgi:dipeptidyl aminopeptidase/acylaminoacyl peptidase
MTKHRCGALGAVLVLALVGAPAAAQKRAITHEDVWLSKRLGAPVLSPDGKWAAVQVTDPSYTETEQSSDLWLVATDGSTPPRKLTASRGGESGAVWSPDGKRIAFSARRDGDESSQIYVLDLSGGEAERVTGAFTGARAPQWRPDGKAILFVSDVYPGAKSDDENRKMAEERRRRKWNARVYDTFPIRDWDRWLDDRRPTLMIQMLGASSTAKDILAGSQLVAGPGFAGQSGSGSDNIAAIWTPDGASVVFAATVNQHEAAFAGVVQSLWMVAAAGGEPKRLTNDKDSYSRPLFSPDGRILFAIVEPATDKVYNLTRLARWEWTSPGTRTVITSKWDRAVASYVPAPDGRSVYVLAEDRGRQRLYNVPLAAGAPAEVGELTSGTLSAMDVRGPAAAPVIVAGWDCAVHPPELVRVSANGLPKPLTSFNADRAAQIDWRPLEEFWFTSSRGKEIQNFVALPPNFDASKKYPLFVLMHGGPHGMWIDQFVIRWNYHLLAQPGYVVLLTNYTGSTGFGEKFSQQIQFDPLEGPANEINEAADAAIKKYPFIDATRQVAGGASYGGHLANWMAVTTTRYKALVSHAGLFDLSQQWGTSDVVYERERNVGGPPWEEAELWTKQSPLHRAGKLKTPMLVTVGERDYRVPMNNAIQLWSALQRMKVPSRLIVFPEENHWVLRGENSRFFYNEIHDWIARWINGPADR